MTASHHTPTITDQRYRRDSEPDIDLVTRVWAGDRQAFADLYLLTVDRITSYVAVRMREGNPDVVPDLVQDAFCYALADPTLIGPNVLGSLLRLAARACTRYQWTRRRYLRAAHTIYDEHHTGRDQLVQAPPRRENLVAPGRVTFAHVLARLTPDQRRAVHLRLLDGYPRDATARLMDRSVDAVRGLERRALHRLRTHLEPPAAGCEPAAAPEHAPSIR